MATFVTPQELQARLKQGERLQLIDVRSPGEFATEHVPQAVNMPVEQVETRLADLQTHAPVVLVCQSGRRAGMACDLLRGHRNDLMILDGGTTAWVEAGLPTVRATAARWSLERQVRLAAGMLVLTGTLLGALINPSWNFLAMFVGAGLTFAGLTNICGMASLFALMPWNKPRTTSPKTPSLAQN